MRFANFFWPFKIAVFSVILAAHNLAAQNLPLSQNLIDFSSDRGRKFLLESEANQDYFPLISQFVTQEKLSFCGVATIVMVLNAMRVPAPEAFPEGRFNFFNQDNFFEKAEKVISKKTISYQGMTLEQLAKLLEVYGVKADIYYGSELTLEEFRGLIVENLRTPENFVIVNYLRRQIGQETGGHISPIAAYHQDSDRFLILDVARYKYPPVWVKAEELWKATLTLDTASGKTRGLVLVNPTGSREISFH